MPTCLIHGCQTGTRVSYLVCDDHAVEVWTHVEAFKDTPSSPIPRDVVIPRAPVDPNAGQWIYYLQLDDKIKIGWTANYSQRMKAYPPHAFVLAKHEGTRTDERDLHRTFKPSRAAGREWYHQTSELMAHIQRLGMSPYAEVLRSRMEPKARRTDPAQDGRSVARNP